MKREFFKLNGQVVQAPPSEGNRLEAQSGNVNCNRRYIFFRPVGGCVNQESDDPIKYRLNGHIAFPWTRG
jgi:hypothetical protein